MRTGEHSLRPYDFKSNKAIQRIDYQTGWQANLAEILLWSRNPESAGLWRDLAVYWEQSSKIRIEPDTIMVSGFSGEHSSPLQSYTIEFVGAFCERPLKPCCYPINQSIHHTCRYTIHDHRPGDGEWADCCLRQEKGGEWVAAVGVQRSRAVGKAHTGHRNRGTSWHPRPGWSLLLVST